MRRYSSRSLWLVGKLFTLKCSDGEVGECLGLTARCGGEGGFLNLNFNLSLDALVVRGGLEDSVTLEMEPGDNGGLMVGTFCGGDVMSNLHSPLIGDSDLGDELVGDVGCLDL